MNLHYRHPVEIYEPNRINDEIGGWTEELVLQKIAYVSINNRANSYKYLAEQNTDTNIFNISVRDGEYEFTLNTVIKFLDSRMINKTYKIVGITQFPDYGYVDLKLNSLEPSQIGV